MSKEKENKKIPYSNHIFFYPFYFNNDTYKLKLQEIGWKKLCLDDKGVIDLEDIRLLYNSYQYFNDMARKAIYGNILTERVANDGGRKVHSAIKRANNSVHEDEVVTNYIFELSKFLNPIYEIKKDSKKYELDIVRITLSIYNTGIGVLCFEMENRKEEQLEDILNINDFGRRVSIACIGVKERVNPIAADEVHMQGVNDSIKLEHYLWRIKEILSSRDEIISELKANNGFRGCANFIKILLTGDYESAQQKEIEKQNDIISIESIMDDRMFTQCLLSSKRYCKMVKKLFVGSKSDRKYIWLDAEHKYNYYLKEKELLYRFIFVDSAGCSCQNEKMLDESLEEVTYKRWTNYGTLTAVTQHSFVCVGAPGDYKGAETDFIATVYNPFLTMYRDMARLAIVQRASIIALAKEATEISSKISCKTEISQQDIEKIQNLQKKYVACQNQLLLFEVTTQLQGIELYEKFQKEFFVKEQRERLESQISNLYDIANINENRRLNDIVLWLTIGSIGLAMLDYVTSGMSVLRQHYKILALLVIAVAIVGIILPMLSKSLDYYKCRWLKPKIVIIVIVLIIVFIGTIIANLIDKNLQKVGGFEWIRERILTILHQH